MAQDNFAAVISAWVQATKERQEAVFLESVQRTVEAAQTAVSAGGNMPVVTGFLRASGKASLGEPEVAVSFKPDEDDSFRYDATAASLTIAGAAITDTVYFTWTANYAAYVEAKRGFVRLAVQQWPQIVSQVSIEAAGKAQT